MSQTKAQLLGPLVADNIDIEGDLNFDSGTLKVDPTNDRVGINKGANAPEKTLDVGGDVQLADLYLTADYPTIRPTLDLAFAQTKQLDSRITFTRSSTATYVDENGIIQTAAVNTPRFDHDPVTGESLGLLIEESRTNLALSSEDFSNTSYWNPTSITVVANTATAPDGTLTADNIVPNSGTNVLRYLYYAANPYSMSASTIYTTSIFVKKNGLRYFAFQVHDNGTGSGHRAGFDLDTGTVVTSNNMGSGTGVIASIVRHPNGWYRCIITGTTASTGTTGKTAFSFSSALDANASVSAITADGVNGGYVWGHQVEQGSFPTSYIPTSGSTVTRSSDIATITGTNLSSWYNQSESTFYVESSSSPASAGKKFFTLDDITTNGSLSELVELATQQTDKVNSFTYNNSTQSDIRVTPAGTGRFKAAAAFKVNDVQISVDGTLGTADTTASHPSQIDRMTIGNYTSGNYYVNCPISRITYYPRRLNNSQLQNITL